MTFEDKVSALLRAEGIRMNTEDKVSQILSIIAQEAVAVGQEFGCTTADMVRLTWDLDRLATEYSVLVSALVIRFTPQRVHQHIKDAGLEYAEVWSVGVTSRHKLHVLLRPPVVESGSCPDCSHRKSVGSGRCPPFRPGS